MTAGHSERRHAGRRSFADVASRDQEILRAAFALFRTSSYHEVSLAAIAAQSKAAVRTIYSSFDGKVGIVKALIELAAAEHRQQIELLKMPEDVDGRLLVLAGHLSARARYAEFRDLQVVVASICNAALSKACYDAGPGQFTSFLLREFAQYGGGLCFEEGLSVDDMVDAFIGIIVGPQLERQFPRAHSAARGNSTERNASRVRLFIHLANPSRAILCREEA